MRPVWILIGYWGGGKKHGLMNIIKNIHLIYIHIHHSFVYFFINPNIALPNYVYKYVYIRWTWYKVLTGVDTSERVLRAHSKYTFQQTFIMIFSPPSFSGPHPLVLLWSFPGPPKVLPHSILIVWVDSFPKFFFQQRITKFIVCW